MNPSRPDNPLENILRGIVYVLVYFLWFTVGSVMWVWIVFRVGTAYSFHLFRGAATSRDMRGENARLDRALHWWIDGFHRIQSAKLTGSESATTEDDRHFWREAAYSILCLIVVFGIHPMFSMAVSYFSSSVTSGLPTRFTTPAASDTSPSATVTPATVTENPKPTFTSAHLIAPQPSQSIHLQLEQSSGTEQQQSNRDYLFVITNNYVSTFPYYVKVGSTDWGSLQRLEPNRSQKWNVGARDIQIRYYVYGKARLASIEPSVSNHPPAESAWAAASHYQFTASANGDILFNAAK